MIAANTGLTIQQLSKEGGVCLQSYMCVQNQGISVIESTNVAVRAPAAAAPADAVPL
jgi:hypothetical protein